MPLSDKWFSIANERFKVWGRKDRPGDDLKVEIVFSALAGQVWPALD